MACAASAASTALGSFARTGTGPRASTGAGSRASVWRGSLTREATGTAARAGAGMLASRCGAGRAGRPSASVQRSATLATPPAVAISRGNPDAPGPGTTPGSRAPVHGCGAPGSAARPARPRCAVPLPRCPALPPLRRPAAAPCSPGTAGLAGSGTCRAGVPRAGPGREDRVDVGRQRQAEPGHRHGCRAAGSPARARRAQGALSGQVPGSLPPGRDPRPRRPDACLPWRLPAASQNRIRAGHRSPRWRRARYRPWCR